jgi:hypothetical protein
MGRAHGSLEQLPEAVNVVCVIFAARAAPMHPRPCPPSWGFLLGRDYAVGMSNDERPEPNWRLLAIVLCVTVVGVALGLIFKWW